ncbi:hypothetical protein HDV01_002271 [Terramyces sp. JEL0728]|nr:hypothetical protein HDV01_002271 [Terramyces sp. JEL0728]
MGTAGYVKTKGTKFQLDGQDHFVYSANYWQAMNLGAVDSSWGDRQRLIQDLDHMKRFGINNLRIMAASEGPDTEPFRMKPSLMPSVGVYNESLLDGLDFAMAEISKRGLKVVLCLNNFWHWSGGFAQYVNWMTGEPIPYPPSWSPELGDYTSAISDKNWQTFIDYAGRFYNDSSISPKCQEIYRNHISHILNRKNKHTGLHYKDDPSIFSFELCNEPQLPSFEWCESTAKFIKSIAPNHMVTVGLESKFDQKDFIQAHSCPSIDYCCNHVWVQNRGEYDMMDSSDANITHAIEWGTSVIDKVDQWAREINKPLLLEEFGFPRDNWVAKEKADIYSCKHTVANRDRYYKAMLEKSIDLRKSGGAYAGFGFWVYSGASRPGDEKDGRCRVGDPHHEAPGWYGVYDTDISTLSMMQKLAESAKLPIESMNKEFVSR